MPLDGRADLYALGCCAWWLLAGREMYPREATDARILREHVYEPVPSAAHGSEVGNTSPIVRARSPALRIARPGSA
jgi:hypothetical protein